MFGASLGLYSKSPDQFRVLSQQGNFELRSYEKLILARLSSLGSFQETRKLGVDQLGKYLSGHNFKVSSIKSHGHFFQTYKSSLWEIGVVLHNFNIGNTPRPINRLIQITEMPPSRCGVIRFKGSVTPEIIFEKAERLKRWIWKNRLQITGPIRVIDHDFGLSLPFLRYSEVLIDVD